MGYQDTSHAAAREIAPRAGTIRAEVLAYLRKTSTPRTADEIAAGLGYDNLTIRPRMTELRDQGLVRDSGKRGQNKSGRKAILWEIAE